MSGNTCQETNEPSETKESARWAGAAQHGAGPIPETIKSGQDSYPLQNPLHARKTAFNQLGRKERKPRQVNNGGLVGTRTPDLYRVNSNIADAQPCSAEQQTAPKDKL